jgi:hypothetical protein
VHIEETFDVIKRAHIATGHGGRDQMVKELGKKNDNVTRDSIELFKSMCIDCQRKRVRPMTKGVVVRPILSKEFSARGQVDLIDMQSLPHDSFKWIMVTIKCNVIRPLTSTRAAEVAYQLMDIFLLFGAPHILQSDNGSEFTAQIISDLKELWPELVIVLGKPCQPQSQGSVERANYDIKDMLVAWMSENDTADWTVGVKFVQFRKNSSFNAGIKQSPYATLFGIEARIGLTSSSLPHDVIQKLQTEDDLLAILSSSSTQPLPDTTQPLSESTHALPKTTQPLPETTQPLPNNSTSIRNNSTSIKQLNLYQKQLNLYQKQLNLYQTTQPLPYTTQPPPNNSTSTKQHTLSQTTQPPPKHT